MFKMLSYVLGLCYHKWEIEDQKDIRIYSDGFRQEDYLYTIRRYVLVCNNCGKIKGKKVKL